MTETALITRWLGERARRVKHHKVIVDAPPERAYRAVLDAPLREMPLSRLLFTIRRISYRPSMTVRDLFTTPPFALLQETAPAEIVFGIGRGGFRAVANFRVEPSGDGACIATETWVETRGWRANILFRAYWLIVGPFSGLIRRELLRAAKRLAETVPAAP